MPRRPDLTPLWRQYRATPTTALRNALVEAHLWLVQRIAEGIHHKLPAEVELDDLVSDGTLGLMEAVAEYDLSRRIKFPTYATPRIRGAIIDGLRELDWAPRLVRSRQGKVDALTSKLLRETGIIPTPEEVREELGKRLGNRLAEKTARDGVQRKLASLSRERFETDSGKDLTDVDLLPTAVTPPAAPVDNRDAVNRILKGLYPAHRLAVLLYTIDGMTLKEIGRVLDLSESRCSQLLSKEALPTLRSRFTYEQARELLSA
jgi:RNA polymerase sigma factor for flagellar operon FliA